MFFTAAVKNFFKKFVKSLHEMKKFVAVFCEICYTSTRKTLIAEDTFTKRTRIEEIALLIEKNGKMSLEELAKQFPDVSDMTLRRDLLELEKENKVIRVRGGAMSVLEVQKRSGEAYAQKSTINTDAKKVIAKKAVALIDDGVSLFLDGGTTALALAKEKGLFTLFNPAPAKEAARVCVKYADLITPNETELRILSGKEGIEEGCAELLNMGAGAVLATLGKDGSFCYGKTGAEKITIVDAGKAVDTTAAGDTYCGALAVKLAEGASVAEAARFASLCSGITVTRRGAQVSIPTRAEAEEMRKTLSRRGI